MSPSKSLSGGQRLTFGLEIGFLLAFVACGYGAAFLFQAKNPPWSVWLIVLLLPLAAAWGIAALSWISPDFAGKGQLIGSAPLTWSLAYVAFCAVVARLATTPSNALSEPFPELAALRLWTDPAVLTGLFVIEALALWIVSLKERRSKT